MAAKKGKIGGFPEPDSDSSKLRLALLESSRDAMVTALDGIIVDCNRSACEMFGMSRYEIIGSSPDELSPPRAT